MPAALADTWTLDAFTSTIHRGGVGLWSWDPVERMATFDEAAMRFWGHLNDQHQSLDTLFERIDPRDRDEAVRMWLASAGSPGPYQYDFRIPQDDSYRWISARGVGGEGGQLDGKVLAVFVDVTPQREAQEALEMLVGEMGHRIGNLFGVASAVTGIVARETTDATELARDLRTRFDEMRQAFPYAIRHSGRGLEPTPLAEVIEHLVAAYSEGGERVRVDVPEDVLVSGGAITDVALVMHELATNAVKYGALATPGGRVHVEGELDDATLRLVWREEGSQPRHDAPERTGFGSRLMEYAVRASLNGTIDRRIEGEAMTVCLKLDRERLQNR